MADVPTRRWERYEVRLAALKPKLWNDLSMIYTSVLLLQDERRDVDPATPLDGEDRHQVGLTLDVLNDAIDQISRLGKVPKDRVLLGPWRFETPRRGMRA